MKRREHREHLDFIIEAVEEELGKWIKEEADYYQEASERAGGTPLPRAVAEGIPNSETRNKLTVMICRLGNAPDDIMEKAMKEEQSSIRQADLLEEVLDMVGHHEKMVKKAKEVFKLDE